MHDRVLIIGTSGTGKTYLTRYFREKGKDAFDADEIPGLAVWTDEKGNPKKITKEEWLTQKGIWWMWDAGSMAKLLERHERLYLFGSSNNEYEFLSLFDRWYYLQGTRSLIAQRLQDPSRENDWGRDARQRDMVLRGLEVEDEKARTAGLQFIDASLPPEKIFQQICGNKYQFREYDTRYVAYFRLERNRLRKALGESMRIRHIGSTSVQGLGGKGIVDILLGAPKSRVPEVKQGLIRSGYEFREKASTPERLFFRRDYPGDGVLRRVHLHLTEYQGKDWNEMVDFREYLSRHPKAMEEYASIKNEGIRKAHGSGEVYRKHKEKFIKDTLKKITS